jgi:2-polyprenyl-3-methyl-5-hydroxy-6-metoxy-1,4-benzoquinol methylase
MNHSPCPICQAPQVAEQGSIEGYRQSTFYKVMACPSCHVSFVDPMASESLLYEHIYQQVQQVPGYARYYELAQEVLKASNPLQHIKHKEDCYFGVIDYLEKNVVDRKELILEVGCGQGYLTYALNQAGYNAVGLDISREVVALAKDKFGDHYHCGTLASFVQTQAIRPKYVICTELIEHLEDPVQFVTDILSLIGAEGRLILTTPNKTERDQSIWDSESPPVHLWWFSRASLQALAHRAGAQLSFVSVSDFYRHKQVERHFSTSPSYHRTPIFDAHYQLIAPVKQRSAFRMYLRDLEKKLKAWLKGSGNPSAPRQANAPLILDEQTSHLSHSICCVLQPH